MTTKKEQDVLNYCDCLFRLYQKETLNNQEESNLFLQLIKIRQSLNIPPHLYKFRECNHINFKTLEQNCIWIPPASNFIDISDCSVLANFDCKDYFVESITSKGYLTCINVLSNCLNQLNTDLTIQDIEIIKSIVEKSLESVTIRNHRVVLANILSIEKETDYFAYIEYIYEIYSKSILKSSRKSRVLGDARDAIYVYSMTSTMDNNVLWENYAKKYTGFCIEYSIPNGSIFVDQKLLHIFPVIYKRNIPQFTFSNVDANLVNEFMLNNESIDKNALDKVMITQLSPFLMQMLYKHNDYKYENEWRILSTYLSQSLQPFPYVSKIIVGKDIKPKNLQCLRKIAKKLKVPITRQVFDSTKNKFTYVLEESL